MLWGQRRPKSGSGHKRKKHYYYYYYLFIYFKIYLLLQYRNKGIGTANKQDLVFVEQ